MVWRLVMDKQAQVCMPEAAEKLPEIDKVAN